MLGRILCRFGWHRMGKPRVVSRWGGAEHRGAETWEEACERPGCGYAIHYTSFPLFTVVIPEDHQ